MDHLALELKACGLSCSPLPPPPMRHGSVAQVLHKKPDILTNGFYVVNGLSKRGEGQADEGGGKGGQRKGEERQEEGNHKIQ